MAYDAPMKLRIATRKSALALAQSEWVAAELKKQQPGLEVELVPMTTIGDQVQTVSLSEIGGKGLFVSEIEQAVLDGRADLAVHSLKDMPADLAEGLILAAVPEREDPRDVLLTSDGAELDDLEAGARIGTNSMRRTLQLRRQRNDLDYAMLRGNVNTRLSKLDDGQYRAIILAYAGLRRLGLDKRPMVPMTVEASVPAVGQGALAVEARAADTEICTLLKKIECTKTRLCVEAERAFLVALGGDCNTPLAGHARFAADENKLRFDGLVGSVDGRQIVRAGSGIYLNDNQPSIGQAQELGQEVAKSILDQGGGALVEAAKTDSTKKLDPRKLV